MSDLIKKGLDKEIFYFSEDNKYINYNTNQKSGKRRAYNESEEKIRAEVLTKLVLEYEYPLNHIQIEIIVTMGSTKKRADIVIYKTKECKKVNIIIETKKKEHKNIDEALEQALSYADAKGAEFAVATNGKEFLYLKRTDEGEESISNIPNFGGDIPKWQYLRGVENSDIKPIDLNDLRGVLKKIHDYLWNGGKRNPAEAFNEFSKIIFTKIMDEKTLKTNKNYTKHYQFQLDRDESKEDLEKRIKGLYDIYKERDSNVFDDKLILDSDEIKFLVKELEKYNLNKTDLDIKGKVFQDFFANFFKGDAGQYFTPMNIVRFIVNLFDIHDDDLVIDPSCGSGGFLLQSLHQIQQKSKLIDNEIEKHNYWHSFAKDKLYGIEISGGIARTAKMNMIIHDDGHTNIITHDGLDRFKNFQEKNTEFKQNSFNYIFTNPPFGSSIKKEKSYFAIFEKFAFSNVDFIDELIDKKVEKKLNNQKSEILFIERYYQLLKDGGKVAVVLPDGILTNSSMQHIRDYIIERFKLLASFSLPQHTFSSYGAGVKSSILVLQKKSKLEEKAFLDKQEEVRDNYVNLHKDEILATRAEAKKTLKIGCEKQQKLTARYENFKQKVIDNFNKQIKGKNKKEIERQKKQFLSRLETIYKFWFSNFSDSEWESEIREEHKLKEEIIRDKIYELVNEEMRKKENYKIFMAIIEEIGEDATGKKTCEYEDTELFLVQKKFKEFYQNYHIEDNVNFH